MTLKESLIKHEGMKLKLYKDSKGTNTIGVGHNIEELGISRTVAMIILDEDIKTAILMIRNQFPFLEALDSVRLDVIIELMFILGPARFSLFKNMINALREKRFKDAAEHLRDSKLCREDISPERTQYLVDRLESGLDLPKYPVH